MLPGRRTRRTRASCETCDMRHHATRLSAVLSRATGHPPTSREFVCPRSAHPSFCGILPPPLSRAGVCLHLLIKSAQIVESGPRETGRRRKHPLPPPPSEGPLSPTAGRCAPARRIVPSSLIAHCVIGFVRGRRIDDTGGFEASVSLFLSRLCVQKRSTHTRTHTHVRTHTHRHTSRGSQKLNKHTHIHTYTHTHTHKHRHTHTQAHTCRSSRVWGGSHVRTCTYK